MNICFQIIDTCIQRNDTKGYDKKDLMDFALDVESYPYASSICAIFYWKPLILFFTWFSHFSTFFSQVKACLQFSLYLKDAKTICRSMQVYESIAINITY